MITNHQEKTLILGFGREGQATLDYLKKHDPTANLAIADSLPEDKISSQQKELINKYQVPHLYFGEDYLASVDEYSLIFKSPGIPLNPKLKKWASKTNHKITSATQLFLETCSHTIIGITGTKGKSTTSALIHHVLNSNGVKSILVGNIGTPALSVLDTIQNGTVVVMEMSSHQLADVTISPSIAVVHNIYPEHLDYYQSMDEYIDAKTNITRYQRTRDLCIFNYDNAYANTIGRSTNARKVSFSLKGLDQADYFYQNNWIVKSKSKQKIFNTQESPLVGKFNILNLFPAIIIGEKLGLSVTQISTAIKSFKPLPHRLQKIGPYHHLTFIDDSLATLPEAAEAAITALEGKVDTIILGGSERHQDYSNLINHLARSTVRNLILFPPTGERIFQIASKTYPHRFNLIKVETMKDAVIEALKCSKRGSYVLLSPAAPSFGVFKDYRDKSKQFKYWIKRLT